MRDKTQAQEPLSHVVNSEQALDIANKFGTPIYVYSQRILEEQADIALNFPNAFGLRVRYAMKANPNRNILRIFDKAGLHIDASSVYEAQRAINSGIIPEKILLTSQEMPDLDAKIPGISPTVSLAELINSGLEFNACSLNQLERYGRYKPAKDVSVRINPGLGSGSTNRTNTGGPSSSFGIWYEDIDSALYMAKKYDLNIRRIHTHIGSGSDPEIWKRVALLSLNSVKRFLDAGHDISILNLGGGYKVARMSYEKSTDLQECGKPVKDSFIKFFERTGKKLELEIEPGTFLVANAGCLISRIIDKKRISKDGYKFLIIDSGMTEITRPALYGAQHPIAVVYSKEKDETQRLTDLFIVSGHCCESGDIFTPELGNPEALLPRRLPEPEIGDLIVVGGAGAYCAGMSTINYNSFPRAAEVLIDNKSDIHLIRERQTLEEIMKNEVLLSRFEGD